MKNITPLTISKHIDFSYYHSFKVWRQKPRAAGPTDRATDIRQRRNRNSTGAKIIKEKDMFGNCQWSDIFHLCFRQLAFGYGRLHSIPISAASFSLVHCSVCGLRMVFLAKPQNGSHLPAFSDTLYYSRNFGQPVAGVRDFPIETLQNLHIACLFQTIHV